MRRHLQLVALGVAALAAALPGLAPAQAYPSHAVTWVITSEPGGTFDQISRAFAPAMSEDLGQPLVIDNRGGAGGSLALGQVARAKPDGYTIITAGVSQLVFNPFFQNVPYDTRKDFAPIGLIGDLVPAMYVHKSLPVRNLKELIDYSKSHKVFLGTHGIGSSFHLAGEIFKARTGAQLIHVPYKGTAPAQQDFIAGRVQVMFAPPSRDLLARIQEGTIHPLASLSDKRLPNLPDVPTFDEAGVKNLGVGGWNGLLAPAGTPKDIVHRLNQSLIKAHSSPLAQKGFAARSMIPVQSTPEEMAARIDREVRFWDENIRKMGLKPKPAAKS